MDKRRDYSGYVYTMCAIATTSGLSLKLDVRNTTLIRNLSVAYASLHFTVITIHFAGTFLFLFYFFGQKRFKLEINARVPLGEKKC